MRRSLGVAIAFGVGAFAIAAPLWISIKLAWDESLTSEKALVGSYARDVLRRTNEAGMQFTTATNRLVAANQAPCSPKEIDLMREIDVTSSYLQAVARIANDTLICTSLGTTQPIPVGPPSVVSEYGLEQRGNVWIFHGQTYPLIVVSKHGFAYIVDPTLLIDTPTEGPDISIAVFIPSAADHNRIVVHGTSLRPEWFTPIPRGTEKSFIDHGYVVSVIRATHADIEVIAASPEMYIGRHVKQFALIFIPIGLICGAGLVWAVTYISRIYLSLPKVLRAAARRKEFFVEYQPIVELKSKRWVGAEALVRWNRSGEVIQPNEFIPTAEASGVITLITEQVAEIVAADLPRMLKLDPNFEIALNLSAVDLRSERTIEVLEKLVRESGARPANFEIEATERNLLQGAKANEPLVRIRAMGISVAIDDFGTGYSSLAYLETLGIDTLKIDKAFVETIGTSGPTSQVVLHIIEMAHSLHLNLVAEGVETEAQAEFLEAHGVLYAQGWLFAKSMPAAALCESMANQADRNQTALV
jgi:sensor c-di-GMP phosphodiesterase-like protein